MPPRTNTASLPFSPVRNSELFANHWLEQRLPHEPEWKQHRDKAATCLDTLAQLWSDKQDTLTPDLGEHTMEDEWVHPALAAFGWEYVYQTQIQGRKPDYALFLTREDKKTALKAGKDSLEFWKSPRIVADAKAWDRRLDRPTKTKDQREFPPEQIEWYLNRTGLEWGLLTNGRQWRLSPRTLRRNQPRFETYLEIDLPLIIERWRSANGRTKHTKSTVLDEFMPWYLLATPAAFASVDGRETVIDRALNGSTEYRVAVGDALREQVFEALRLCIEGFLSHKPNRLDTATDMAACRANAFTLLFRLLFILFAEDRQLLPYRKNDLYTRNRALSRQHSELAAHMTGLSSVKTTVWEEWNALFALIDEGKTTYGVPAYNGGLFDSASHPFLTTHGLPDSYAARVLDHLRRAPENPADLESDRVRVDYRDLAIQHLGNIYEGLLELHPRYASEAMIVVQSRDGGKTVEKTIAASAVAPEGFEPTGIKHKAGEVYLETDKGERRASGSYYTPDHIVAYIVEQTLGPLCTEIDGALTAEIEKLKADHKQARSGLREAIAKDLGTLRGDFDDRVLRLTVLDPAMGSGHFLLRSCQYLAEQIATNPNADDPDEPESTATGEEPTLLFWKRRVIERCIFGVDKNPIAVELAKLALWLETVSVDQPLSFLDHHLRHGDSLIGATIDLMGRLHDPRVSAGAQFRSTVEHYTEALLKPLDEIRRMPSQTVQQVKAKEKLYRTAFEPRRAPFVHLADLWVSDFFLPEASRLTAPEYAAAVKLIPTPGKFADTIKEPRYAAAIDLARSGGVDAFHWELEFPEVFLSPERKLAGREGFDAIIGNPPYDVLSEKELGRDLSAFKGFIEAMPIYEPSRRGKNNLYKLFICRGLDLLADGGRFGFIVPMAVLGDDQAADIRKAILRTGALTAVEAFPQKDDPAKRVFAEAKLSTTVLVMVRTENSARKSASFVVRQHPADTILPTSPALAMHTSEIPLYDRDNLALVSCSQEDWNLAVRLMGSGRLSRLSDYATSFQGEVNETNDRSKATISYNSTDGPEVVRGAHVCMYAIRDASQGRSVFVKTERFLDGKSADSKALHHRHARVGFQRKSPQNNFRRLIACPVPSGTFLLESVSYVPEPLCKLPLEVVLALLNSNLCEWYFRLGSTNAMVGEYQLNNLPCPAFADHPASSDNLKLRDAALAAIKSGRLDSAFDVLKPLFDKLPFSKAIQDVLVDLVKRIIRAEKARGVIARAERSKLADNAQPFQALIDRILYAMAGLSEDEARGLEERLARML